MFEKLTKGELIALHKALMFAKFPLEEHKELLAGSPIINGLLQSVREELNVHDAPPANLADYPDYLNEVKTTIKNMDLHTRAEPLKSELLDIIIFPFRLDTETRDALLNN